MFKFAVVWLCVLRCVGVECDEMGCGVLLHDIYDMIV